MSETQTPALALPLLAADQAMKHVTVNEALLRLDAALSAAQSRSAPPPPSPAEGDVYIAPPDAEGPWAGRGGEIAYFSNGGWVFLTPGPGRALWVADEARRVVFDGVRWRGVDGATRHGAGTALSVATVDHALAGGAASSTPPIIPDKAVVVGVTAVVLQTLTGPGLASWRLGAPGASGRYGSGYGAARGSTALGITGAPTAYYADTPLLIEAEQGSFDGGVIRICAHFLQLTPPSLG